MVKARGQGMVEYGLIVGLISIVVTVVIVSLYPSFKQVYDSVVSEQQTGEAHAGLSAMMYND